MERRPGLLATLERYPPASPGGRALDVASGRGRHALELTGAGYCVHAIDRDGVALAELRDRAVALSLPITIEALDLETDPPPSLGEAIYDLIVVVNYLHRPLAGRLVDALAPGGTMFYQTFTVDQPRFGKPTNREFLLAPGELVRMFRALTVLSHEEGIVEGPSAVATLVARREPDEAAPQGEPVTAER